MYMLFESGKPWCPPKKKQGFRQAYGPMELLRGLRYEARKTIKPWSARISVLPTGKEEAELKGKTSQEEAYHAIPFPGEP
jgi:hypothetical protein